jgi:hypothetical protein
MNLAQGWGGAAVLPTVLKGFYGLFMDLKGIQGFLVRV